MEEPPVRVTTNKARGGVTPHIVRYVLAASLGLAIVALAVVGFARSF